MRVATRNTAISITYVVLFILTSAVTYKSIWSWSGIRGIIYVDTRQASQRGITTTAIQDGLIVRDVSQRKAFVKLTQDSLPEPPKTPTLVVGFHPSSKIVGSQSVNSFLSNSGSPENQRRSGEASVLFLAVATIAVYLQREKARRMAGFVGPLGLLVGTLLPGNCALCNTGVPISEALALPFSSLIFLAAIVIFTFGRVASPNLVLFMSLIAGIVPFGQCYLQLIDPRFCPVCLTIGICCQALFFASVESLADSTIKSFRLPKYSSVIALLVCPICLFKIWSALWTSPITISSKNLSNLVGTRSDLRFRFER